MNIPLKINKIIKSSAQSRLLARVRLLADLDAQLQALLVPPLQQHCRVLALREPVLVLAADSPVWAVRLRFHAPQLVRRLSLPQSVRLRSIRVRVRPPQGSGATAAPLKPVRRRGHRGTAAIQQAAETVSDPALKSSLLRLASRHKNH
jgi:hypothetical protein